MNQLHTSKSSLSTFRIDPGETVTAWAMSATEESYFPGQPTLAEDRVNYQFINGFVDVGDLPCRRALWANVHTRDVKLDVFWTVDSINLPGFNRRLEFSGFWHRPTRLKRWCKAVFKPQEDGDHTFRLATCGGVHIWVDGTLAARFEPYSRNREQQTTITLPLRRSGSEIVMLAEELAERDTNWYVELTLEHAESIETLIASSADPEVIGQLMALARDIRPAQEFVTGGPLHLLVDETSDFDVAISAKILPSVHLRDNPPILTERSILQAGSKCVEFIGINALPDGYHALQLSFEAGETRVAREIAFAKLSKVEPPNRAAMIRERKIEALDHAAEQGEMRIGRALAILAQGKGLTSFGEQLVENTLYSVDERFDCSDFVLVPLLWLLGAYNNELPDGLAARIKQSILGYRYWVDEPGNDTMWFWSENHVLCFHTSQYLAAGLFPDDVFVSSGRKGHEQRALAEQRLRRWFDSVESHGFAEWNSAAYYPIDFIGLLALHHWGEGEICQRAHRLLDRLFKMIALHTLAGVPAGSMGRAYDKELRAGPNTELAPFATVAFGQGWLNDGVAALSLFCLSDYEPPSECAELVFPPAGKAVQAHYVQGYDTAARLALYKTASVQLSASIDGTPGATGHQQHMIDVRFSSHPFARAWINHPGEDDPWGHQRPSYWAGNGAMPRVGQYDNVALMLFDIPPDHRIDFTHVYAPQDAFDQCEIFGEWLIVMSGSGFAAFTPCKAIEKVCKGPGENREFRAQGRKTGWTIIVGDLPASQQAEDALAAVRDGLAKTKLRFDENAMTLSVQQPDGPRLDLSYTDGLSVDHIHHPFPNNALEPKISVSSAAGVLGL